MSKWSAYYQNRVGENYAKYAQQRYAPMIKELLGFNLYKEEGCGIGTISKILKWQHSSAKILLTDLCEEQLTLALQNLLGLPSIHLRRESILQSQYDVVDVIFSHGVLEHFSNVAIKCILDRQKQQAKKVVHYVPTNKYDTPSFGDERLLPVEWWINNWKPTKYKIFNDQKDLLLVWEGV